MASTEGFISRLKETHPKVIERGSYGWSNLPVAIDGAFRIGQFNLHTTNFKELAEGNEELAFVTRILLPDRQLDLALLLSGESLMAAGSRRDEIVATLQAKKADAKASLVGVYLNQDGLYLMQPETTRSFSPVPVDAGTAIKPTAIYFADLEHEANLSPAETAYVAHLASFKSVPLQRLGPAGPVGGEALDPSTIKLSELTARIRGLGGFYLESVVQRYHVALNHLQRKHFVLLTGISGTGKTLLAKAYAYAILGLGDLQLQNADFKLIPVRPDWTEPAHILGYWDAVYGKYSRTQFLDAVLRAHEHPERPVFICLDEMNLAQPEHYFADILSAMESGESLHLHQADDVDDFPQNLPWPKNLYITGTVNVDETTRPFSPKVLDRANVIDMSEVDVAAFASKLVETEPALAGALDKAVVSLLNEISATLSPHHLHFGLRTIEEIAHYLLFSVEHDALPDALDLQIEQKILTKLRGGPEQRAMLDSLLVLLKDQPRSLKRVQRMRKDLELYDSFQYWA